MHERARLLETTAFWPRLRNSKRTRPCLGSILTLLATQVDLNWAALLLVFYAIGAAIPMLAIGYGGQYVAQRVRGIAPYTQRLQQAFGVLVVSFAIAMYFQYDTLLAAWLSNNLYPAGQIGLCRRTT